MHRLQRLARAPYIAVSLDIALQRTTLDSVTGEVEDNENILVSQLTGDERTALKELMKDMARMANGMLDDGTGHPVVPLVKFVFHTFRGDEAEFNASLLDPAMSMADVEDACDQLLSMTAWTVVTDDDVDGYTVQVQAKVDHAHSATAHNL